MDPADGQEVVAANGRYGPYVSKGKETRSLANEEQLLEITLDEALALLAQPRAVPGPGRRGAQAAVCGSSGTDPSASGRSSAKDGRFGVYVTDGETNASLGRGDRLEEMTPERAYELLAIRREQVAEKGGPTAARRRRPRRPRPKPAKKKAPRRGPPANP